MICANLNLIWQNWLAQLHRQIQIQNKTMSEQQNPAREPPEEEDEEKTAQATNHESSSTISASTARRIPIIPVPAADQMVGKEKLVSLPPLAMMGAKYIKMSSENFIHRKEYLTDCCIVVAGSTVFASNNKARELSELAVDEFEENIQLFCGKSGEGFQTFLFNILLIFSKN